MEAIKNSLGEMLLALRERFFNPLYMSYAFAWAVMNLRFIQVLLSDLPLAEKFAVTDALLYPGVWDIVSRQFVYPALIAVAIVFVGPRVNRLVSVYLKKQEKLTLEEMYKVAEIIPISPEVARRMVRTQAEQNKRASIEVDELTATVASLQEQLAKLDDQRSHRANTDAERELSQLAQEHEPVFKPSDVNIVHRKGRWLFNNFPEIGMSGSTLAYLKGKGLNTNEVDLLRLIGANGLSKGAIDKLRQEQGLNLSVAYGNLEELKLIKTNAFDNIGKKVDLTPQGQRVLVAIEQKDAEVADSAKRGNPLS